jgi:hypothetical protein
MEIKRKGIIFKMRVTVILSTLTKCIFTVEKNNLNECHVFFLSYIVSCVNDTCKGNNMQRSFNARFHE